MTRDAALKAKRVLVVVVLLLVVIGSIMLIARYGDALVAFVSDPQRLHAWVDKNAIASRFAMFGLVMAKTVIPFFPGEPFEIAAGYAFGAVGGTILCAIGSLMGSLLVFLFVRRVGVKAVELFYPREKLLSLRFLQNDKQLAAAMFFIFLIPGTPKDLLGYFVGLTRMRISSWVLISGVARLPSIIISTVGGQAMGSRRYTFAAIVFVLSVVISGIGFLLYRQYVKKHNQPEGS